MAPVKDHSYSERGNPLPSHGLLFPISSKGSLICTIQQTGRSVTPILEHWLEREIAQWVHHERSIRRTIAPRANALTTELHLAPSWQTFLRKINSCNKIKIKTTCVQWRNGVFIGGGQTFVRGGVGGGGGGQEYGIAMILFFISYYQMGGGRWGPIVWMKGTCPPSRPTPIVTPLRAWSIGYLQ